MITEKQAIKDGQIIPESQIVLSLTFDHRIIDDAVDERFLKTVKEIIEDPILIIV
jgi:pyruvate/2-oxoglutarate dehydrogenase complex dihydrolipoamide acyltransferase (E2) component